MSMPSKFSQAHSAVITVIGAGYVGLTTAVCMAKLGHFVHCVDIDESRINRLSKGEVPFFEPGLSNLLEEAIAGMRVQFSTSLDSLPKDTEFVFLCLPTPSLSDGSVDLSALNDVVANLRGLLQDDVILITKSTVPIGFNDELSKIFEPETVHVASNPEFLREGCAVDDFFYPGRIVIGAHPDIACRIESLYRHIDAPRVVVSIRAAETIKYFANAFLALKVSFVNEIASFCEASGSDVEGVLEGLRYDVRIGSHGLRPGPGWGGSCFPKDTRALVAEARRNSISLSLVETAIVSNELHIEKTCRFIEREILRAGSRTQVVAVLGVTFKANTDDIRESPAVRIIRWLVERGLNIRIYDPVGRCPSPLDQLQVATSWEAMEHAEVAIILTEWEEFAEFNPDEIVVKSACKTFIDCRYVLDKDAFGRRGIFVTAPGKSHGHFFSNSMHV